MSISRAGDLTPEQVEEALSHKAPADRADMIHDWMVRGWYVKGRTHKQLAKVWGIVPSSVRHYSTEAVHRFRKELLSKNRDELLAELLLRIGAIGQDALERTEEVVDGKGDVHEVRRPDHRTALRAAEATGELLGLKVQRHHHTVTAGELTTEQIVAQLQAHGVEVRLPVLTSGVEVTEPDAAAQKEDERNGNT